MKFFHASTVNRRRRNRVLRLKVVGDDWCEDQEVLKEKARDFFAHLYYQEPCLPCDPTAWRFPMLSHSDRRLMNKPVSSEEVREAVAQMGPYKAPGPDGFPPCIFQKYWHILGATVTEAVSGMFATGKLLPRRNNGLICLIPKTESP